MGGAAAARGGCPCTSFVPALSSAKQLAARGELRWAYPGDGPDALKQPRWARNGPLLQQRRRFGQEPVRCQRYPETEAQPRSAGPGSRPYRPLGQPREFAGSL